jgi:hypothetical protein
VTCGSLLDARHEMPTHLEFQSEFQGREDTTSSRGSLITGGTEPTNHQHITNKHKSSIMVK